MELKYADTTEKIIGSAMKVHGRMGTGYPEIIYARCLAIEFDRMGLRYEKEKSLSVYYDEFVVGARRVDFMVEQKIVVALKALTAFQDKDFVQALNYLQSHRQEIALLLNFGAKSLQFKRIINNKNLPVSPNPTNLINEPAPGYNPGNPFEIRSIRGSGNPSKNPDNPWS